MTMKTNPRVAVARCPDYAPESLRAALLGVFSQLGGLEGYVRRGARVFVKPNLLSPLSSPDEAVYTHPDFTHAVLRLLVERGCEIVVGDDVLDGGRAFESCGYERICRDAGARLINVREAGFTEVACRAGGVLDRVHIARVALEADAVINLPKFKTHAYMGFTGAVKNSFGLIPHGERLRLHRVYRKPAEFARALLDIHAALPPSFNIMDAVVAMEGLGPAAGRPRAVGLVLAAEQAVTLDAVASMVAGFDPDDVLTTCAGRERGLGESRPEAVDVLGERIEEVAIADFDRPAGAASLLGRPAPSALYAFVQSRMGYIPRTNGGLCTACGTCVKSCPADAISLRGPKAVIDRDRCIKCLCCAEMCPSRAVVLAPMFLRRLARLFESARHPRRPRPSRPSQPGS